MGLEFKKILGDELVKKLDEAGVINEIVDKLGAAKLIQNDEGEFIPRGKFSEKVNALNGTIDELNKQLEQRSSDFADLENKVKAGANAAEELEKLREKHKEDTATLKEELEQTKLRSAVEVALLAAKIKKAAWAKHLTDEIMRHSDKLLEKDGKYIGLEELVKDLKESEDYKEWFGEIKVNGEPPDPGKEKDLMFEGRKWSELTLTDKLVLKQKDAAKYERMSGQKAA